MYEKKRPFSRWTWVSQCLLKQRMVEVVVTTGLLELKVVQSSSQIITTNKPTSGFIQAVYALPVAHQQCQSTEGKISHSMVLLTPSSFGGLPTLSLTTNSSWLPWGRVAMPLISLLMPVPPDINRQVLLIHEQSTVRSKISRRRKNTLKNAWVNSVSSSFWRFLGFNLYRKNHGSLWHVNHWTLCRNKLRHRSVKITRLRRQSINSAVNHPPRTGGCC